MEYTKVVAARIPLPLEQKRCQEPFNYVFALPLLRGQDNPGDMAHADAVGLGAKSSNAPTDLQWRDDRSVMEGKAVLLGGVSWGFLNLKEPKYIKAGALEGASENLTEAIKKFQAFYWPK